MPCEKTVASAAPGIPQPSTRMAIGSSATLIASVTASRIVGILLSPSARMRQFCM